MPGWYTRQYLLARNYEQEEAQAAADHAGRWLNLILARVLIGARRSGGANQYASLYCLIFSSRPLLSEISLVGIKWADVQREACRGQPGRKWNTRQHYIL